MTRIFLPGTDPEKTEIVLEGKDSNHIAAALRMKSGERLIICNGKGLDFECVIISSSAKQTVCRVENVMPSPAEMPVKVDLFQCLPKGDKFEFIIQKTTELGVNSITPVISERCISRPDAASLSKKLARWGEIAREAAQQSGRGTVPEIKDAIYFPKAAASLPSDAVKIICDEDEKQTSIKTAISGAKHICVFIGPEGGFSDNERKISRENGLTPVTLGNRILRCETAPVFVMSAFSYEFELN